MSGRCVDLIPRVAAVASGVACRVRFMGKTPIHGEALHELGRDGARRAKQWLESTSRVDTCHPTTRTHETLSGAVDNSLAPTFRIVRRAYSRRCAPP